jgi:uridylate kinase
MSNPLFEIINNNIDEISYKECEKYTEISIRLKNYIDKLKFIDNTSITLTNGKKITTIIFRIKDREDEIYKYLLGYDINWTKLE